MVVHEKPADDPRAAMRARAKAMREKMMQQMEAQKKKFIMSNQSELDDMETEKAEKVSSISEQTISTGKFSLLLDLLRGFIVLLTHRRRT